MALYFNDDWDHAEWGEMAQYDWDDNETYMTLDDMEASVYRNYAPVCYDDEFWDSWIWWPDFTDSYIESGDFFAVTQDPVFDWWTAEAIC